MAPTITQRKCKLCGTLFNATGKNMYCSNVHKGICEVCGAEFIIHNVHTPDRTCSVECRKLLRKKNAEKTSLEKYGVKNAGFTKESQAKINETCLKKYGVEWAGQSEIQKSHVKETFDKNGGNPLQRPEIREKVKQTCLDRYGSESVLSKNSSIRDKVVNRAIEKYGTADPGNLPEFREKAKQTSISKYGSEFYTQTDEYKDRVRETCLRKYGKDHFTQSEEYKQNRKDDLMRKYGAKSMWEVPGYREKVESTNMDKYGVPYYCMHPDCIRASGTTLSKINKQFGDMLSNVTKENCEFEHRIGRFSFDIRQGNNLIEIDPTFTHTTASTKMGNKDKGYHLRKSEAAKEAGFRCIHVFDWDDWDKVISILSRSNKSIGARSCSVKEVSIEEADAFLADNHLQGTCKGQTVRLGLYAENDLVHLMTFGKPRYNNKFEWELLRLCSKSGMAVLGGSEKLMKYFLENYKPSSVVSYCDNAKFSGDCYYKLGFRLADKGSPSKHWSKGNRHVTDNLLRQRGYDQLFGTDFGKGTSNDDLMLKDGWLPIYDCGQSRFEWRSA